MTCAPGVTQASSTTGVGDEVTSTDDVGAAHRRLGRFTGPDRRGDPARHVADESLAAAALRAPHAHVGQRPHFGEGVEMAAGLDAGTDDRQAGGIGAGEGLGRHRRDGGRTGLGDVASVHHRDERPRSGVEKHDRGQMRRQAPGEVPVEDGHQLRPQLRRLGDEGRHHAEERLLRPHGEHASHRLEHVARREAGEGGLHRLDQIGRRQQGADVVFGEEAEALRHPLVVHQAGHASVAGATPVRRCR